jgi:hypothetical protein
MSHIAKCLIATFFLVVALLGCATAGDAKEQQKTHRILFLGNSITLHGPAPDIGWLGNWGMAASAKEKDYVHVLTHSIAQLTGSKPEVQTASLIDFEHNYATYNADAKLKQQLAFKADIVVVAIGENVRTFASEAAKTSFSDGFLKLLKLLKNNGQPAIFVRGCFWPDKTKDAIMQRCCAEVGGVFVDISALGKDESNFAQSERKFAHHGVAIHPGDKGMKAIADALFSAMSEKLNTPGRPTDRRQ